MKLFFRRLHLYMALAAGVVIMMSCLTGAVLVFQEEMEHSFFKSRYYVQPMGERVAVEQLVTKVQSEKEGVKVASVRIFNDPSRSVEMNYRIKDAKSQKNQAKLQDKGKPKQVESSKAFINPYTGEVLAMVETRKTFFFKVLQLHRFLLASDTGKLITGISTLIFLFIIITGIVLWWPANMNILKQRLKIKRGAGWKRTNHDLHLVFGFYSSIILFVFAFTALAWSFKWFNNGIYYVTNSPVKNPEPPKSLPFAGHPKSIAFDAALSMARIESPDAIFYNIAAPKEENDAVIISMLRKTASLETATDMIYMDRNTGKAIGHMYWTERSTGAKVRAAFRPVHTASVFGTTSKLLGFLVCIFGACLPVTGITMWINRIRKKK